MKTKDFIIICGKNCCQEEITKTRINRTINHYEFTGEKVQHMRLKEIYYMLQNWLLLSHIKKKAKFTINIGRENFSFRLFHGVNSQLLIEPGNGGQPDSYDDLFEKINEVDHNLLARLMLDSLNKPLNDQPNWNTALSEVLDDEKIKTVTDAAKMLMTLTHVAEAARPKKKTWESWNDVMDEVICLSQSQQETFRKSSHDVFKKQNRRPYETQDEYNTLFEEINRLMADYFVLLTKEMF